MGIVLKLHLLPERIDPAEWAAAWEETLRVVREHPCGPLRLRERNVEGVRVFAYSRNIELDRAVAGRAWSVSGDRQSLEGVETFEMLRDLDAYRSRWRGATPDDVLSGIDVESGSVAGVPVLGAKTQGRPAHVALLAAAMVVEDRFPRAALVSGDIDRADGSMAQRHAESVLGRPIALPVLVDPERLVERLGAECDGAELAERFVELDRSGDPRAAAAVVSHLLPREGDRWFALTLRRDPERAIGWMTAWLEATGDLLRLCRLACSHDDGPRLSASDLVDRLAATGLLVPREPLDALGELFRSVSGEPGSVAEPLFALLAARLDAGPRRGLSPGEVEDALGAAFGDEAAKLIAVVRERNEKTVETIARLRAIASSPPPSGLTTSRSRSGLATTAWSYSKPRAPGWMARSSPRRSSAVCSRARSSAASSSRRSAEDPERSPPL
jgi:hypothetical protein